MEPDHWLEKFAPGYDQLSAQERKAVKEFSLLWSLFEGRVLSTRASANAIIGMVDSLKTDGKLILQPFTAAIDHFFNRYYDGTNLTPEFDGLHFRPCDHRPLVEKAIKRQSTDDAEVLCAILIIIFRLRNNLFHGIKWSYGIRGQRANFLNANQVLMAAIEQHPLS